MQEKRETNNPVIKALIASYKKLVAKPTKDDKRAHRRVYAGTNSRIRRTEVVSPRASEE